MMKTLLSSLFVMFTLQAAAQQVLLDSYFNNEVKKDSTGRTISWHYKWSETPNSGFSLLATEFLKQGADTATLYEAPRLKHLKGAGIYIIVDADNEKESPRPNFISTADIRVIEDWVKKGGVLVLMGNDSANAELKHFSELSSRFGIYFTNRSRNMVKGKDFPTGAVHIPAGNEVFPSVKKVYLKEVSILDIKPPARALITKENDVIMAVAKVGKGTVFAVGDPWLYNEYTDGRRIPAEYENAGAAADLVKWLLGQSAK